MPQNRTPQPHIHIGRIPRLPTHHLSILLHQQLHLQPQSIVQLHPAFQMVRHHLPVPLVQHLYYPVPHTNILNSLIHPINKKVENKRTA